MPLLYVKKEEVDVMKIEKVVYNNGCAIEIPDRERAREKFSREELGRYYDQKIARKAEQWGEDYIYTQLARESKVKNLEKYDEGKVVIVYSNEYQLDGLTWLDVYYSDGTKTTSCCGYN